MVMSIMDWLEQVLAAKALVRLEAEQARVQSGAPERLADYQTSLDLTLAVKKNPTNWKLYKAFQTALGWNLAGDIPFKDFTKLDAEREAKLRERVIRWVEKAEQWLRELLAQTQEDIGKYQAHIDAMRAKIKIPDILGGVPGKRVVNGLRAFPVDVRGWKYEEGFKDKVEARVRAELAPMINMLRQQDNDGARNLLKDFEARWEAARDSYGLVYVDAEGDVPKGGKASWQPMGSRLTVRMSSYYSPETLLDLERSVRHELRHFVQSYLGHMTGHLYEAMGLGKKMPPSGQHIPRPGMPSRHIMTPDIQQSHTREQWEGRKMPPEVAEGIRDLHQRGIYPSEVHSLDDIEFYTNLADAVDDFTKMQKWHPEWTPENLRMAIKLYTFEMTAPHRTEDWNPYGGWERFNGVHGSKFFIALRKHAPGKWRKAVGELVKAVT